jgi:hypothetical protein
MPPESPKTPKSLAIAIPGFSNYLAGLLRDRQLQALTEPLQLDPRVHHQPQTLHPRDTIPSWITPEGERRAPDPMLPWKKAPEHVNPIIDAWMSMYRTHPQVPLWEGLSQETKDMIRGMPALKMGHEDTQEPLTPIDLWDREFTMPLVALAGETELGLSAIEKLGELMELDTGLLEYPTTTEFAWGEPTSFQPNLPGPTVGELLESIEWADQPWMEMPPNPFTAAAVVGDLTRMVRSFHKMKRFLWEKLQTRGTPDQYLNTIQAFARKGNFSKHELFWSGLEDAIRAQKGTITKQWIDDWLTANAIKIKVTPLTGDDTRFSQWMEIEGGQNYREILIQWDRTPSDAGKISFERWMEELWSGNPREDWPVEGMPEYASDLAKYQNYLELGDDPNFDAWLKVVYPEEYQRLEQLGNTLEATDAWDAIRIDSELQSQYTNDLREIRGASALEIDPDQPSLHRDQHFPSSENVIANILVMDIVDPVTGEKTMHIFEIQSDWHQKGRIAGYNIPNPESAVKEQNLLNGILDGLMETSDSYIDELNASFDLYEAAIGRQELESGTGSGLGTAFRRSSGMPFTREGGISTVRRLRRSWHDRAEDLQVERSNLQDRLSLAQNELYEASSPRPRYGYAPRGDEIVETRFSTTQADAQIKTIRSEIEQIELQLETALAELGKWDQAASVLSNFEIAKEAAEEALELAKKGDWDRPRMWTNPVERLSDGTYKREPFPTPETVAKWREEKASYETIIADPEFSAEAQLAATQKKEIIDKLLGSRERDRRGIDTLRKDAVSDAPFRGGKGNSWTQLALKTMIQQATEQGYSKITWSSGVTVINRYDVIVRENVDSIDWIRNQDAPGEIELTFNLSNGNIKRERIQEHDASLYIGQTAALELSDNLDNAGSIDAEGIKIGGEELKRFYDAQLVREANKIAKRFKSEVRTTHDGPPGPGAEASVASVPHFREWVSTKYKLLTNQRARRLNIQRNQAQARLDARRKLYQQSGEQLTLPGSTQTPEQYNAAHRNLTDQLDEANRVLEAEATREIPLLEVAHIEAYREARGRVDQLTRDLEALGPAPGPPTAATATPSEYTWEHYWQDVDILNTQVGHVGAQATPEEITAAQARVSNMRARGIQEGVPSAVFNQRPGYERRSFREWLGDSDLLPEVELELSNYRRSDEAIADSLGIDLSDEHGALLGPEALRERISEETGGAIDLEVEFDMREYEFDERNAIDGLIDTMFEDDESPELIEYLRQEPGSPGAGPILPSSRKSVKDWYIEKYGAILSDSQIEDVRMELGIRHRPEQDFLSAIDAAELAELDVIMQDPALFDEYITYYLRGESTQPLAPPRPAYETVMTPEELSIHRADQEIVRDAEGNLRELVIDESYSLVPARADDISEASLQRMGLLDAPEGDDPLDVYFSQERPIDDAYRQSENNTFFDFKRAKELFETNADRTDFDRFGDRVMKQYTDNHPESVSWTPIGWDTSQGPTPTFPTQTEAATASSPPVHTLDITQAMIDSLSQDPSMGLPLFSMIPPIAMSMPDLSEFTLEPSHETTETPAVSPLIPRSLTLPQPRR